MVRSLPAPTCTSPSLSGRRAWRSSLTPVLVSAVLYVPPSSCRKVSRSWHLSEVVVATEVVEVVEVVVVVVEASGRRAAPVLSLAEQTTRRLHPNADGGDRLGRRVGGGARRAQDRRQSCLERLECRRRGAHLEGR